MQEAERWLRDGVEGEFSGAKLGDERRTKRLEAMAGRVLRAPGAGFPKMVADEAELEATYRFLSNDAVEPDAMLEPHMVATLKRMAQFESVLVVHDTTHFNFGGASQREGLGTNNGKGQGFSAHVALAVAPGEARVPLGICAVERINRTKAKNSNRKRSRHLKLEVDRESLRWQRSVKKVEQQRPTAMKCIHVMDREGDNYDLLDSILGQKAKCVIRVSHDRALVDEEQRLFEHLESLPARASRVVELSQRSHVKRKEQSQRRFPQRQGRKAQLSVSGCSVELKRPETACSETRSLSLNVVRVWERKPPKGEPPVTWVLYTTESIATTDDLMRIVDIYRSRWLVEEYFKALKTGCAFEKRQLESYDALAKALSLFIPIAWRLLLTRALSRQTPRADAKGVLTRQELTVLSHQLRLEKVPATVEEALCAVARLGGHLKRNGPPGWITIGRGMETLHMLTLGWRLAREGSEM